MNGDREEQIRIRAHEIWEEEGQPDGKAEEHWQKAARELGGLEDDDAALDGAGGASAPGFTTQPQSGGAETSGGDTAMGKLGTEAGATGANGSGVRGGRKAK